jgi:transcriptional regulator with XRE-family HTH domain
MSASEFEWNIWVNKNVGSLLAKTPHLNNFPARETVATAFVHFIKLTTQGNIAEFSRGLGMRKNAVWQWQAGKALPQLLVLLQLCKALKLSLVNFLLETDRSDETDELDYLPKFRSLQVSQNKKGIFSHDQIQKRLVLELLEDQPKSLSKIAQEIEINPRTLRRSFPNLCTEISKRYKEHQGKLRNQNISRICQEVRQIAIDLHRKGIDPTRSNVSQCLSKPAYFREREVILALENIRSELGIK